jgi:protocatechuate 3,4-dioxygenase, beta subunit
MISRRAFIGGMAGTVAARAASGSKPLLPTPHEILGPYYPLQKPDDQDADLTLLRGRSRRAAGEIVEVIGKVLWRDGSPARGARIEVWQANAAGKYRHPHDPNAAPIDPDFQGYANMLTGQDGAFRLLTVKPGPYPARTGRLRTPHIHFDFTTATYRLVTQMYFPGEPLNETDDLIAGMMASGRDPSRLIANALPPAATGAKRYEWTVVLR